MNKWETHIEPYLAEIEKWSRRGITEKEIAEKLGVAYSTFRKYAKSKPELGAILKRGKRHAQKLVEKALAADDVLPKKYTPILEEPTPIYIKGGGVARPDQNGTHRGAFEKAKKRIYATQTVCGICGRPVDKALKYPHPLAPCIDHIIPIAKGGHPSDINNLQLAHWTCNRQKSDKLIERTTSRTAEVISNRILPHSVDWKNYRSSS